MRQELQTRLWQHDNLWRIQSLRQLQDRHGTLQDAWESRRDEDGHVLFFETEEQAREHMDSEAKKVEEE